MTDSTKPTQPSERLDFIDIIRGVAVLGILMVNMASFSGRSLGLTSFPEGWDRWAFVLVEFLGRAKFYSLFSFLFGWGMALMLVRSEARGDNFVRRYVRRLLFLLLLGIIHGIFIWRGDILTTYALLGFVLILFRHRSERFILITSLLLLTLSIVMAYPSDWMTSFRDWWADLTNVFNSGLNDRTYADGTYAEITQLRLDQFWGTQTAIPYYFGNIFAMFLWGLYVGKRRIFEELDSHWPLIKRVFWISLVVGLLANVAFTAVLFWFAGSWPDWLPDDWGSFLYTATRTIAAPAIMLVYLTGILLLLRYRFWRQKLAPIGNVGRTALSNYILQSIIGTLIFYSYGLGIYGRLGPMMGLVLTVLIFLFQIWLSGWWLERFRYGSLEWLWRSWTYGRFQQLRRGRGVFDFEDEHPPRWYEHSAVRLLLVILALVLLWQGYQWWQNRHLISAENGANAITLAPTETPTPRPSATPAATALPTPTATPIATPAVQPVSRSLSDTNADLAAAYNTERAIETIAELIGEPYNGRLAGSAGGYAAGEFIAEAFAEAGLQPAGVDGTFFQPFELEAVSLSAEPELSLISADGTAFDDYEPFEDFAPVVRAYAGSGSASGELTWVSNCSPQEFAPISVAGRIAVCRYVPGLTNPYQMARNALEQGASGLLLLSNDDARPLDFGIPYGETWLPDGLNLPTMLISPDVADDLLQGSGLAAVDLAINYTPFELPGEVTLSISAESGASCISDPCQGRNVLAVLPGRDPDVAHEVIILGAHYDHIGQSPDGTTWYGANDNASGTAALIEIARTWQEQGYVPRRTVLFAAWDGEELGVLGSDYYVQYPQYPLNDTVGSIQLDMIGGGEDILYIDGVGGLETELQTIAEDLGWETELSEIGRSDHTPFLEAGVPANLLIWFGAGDGVPSYHRPTDTLDVIEPDKLTGASQVAMLQALTLAEAEPALDELVAARASAVAENDLAAFLATSSDAQQATDANWFAQVQTLNPVSVEATVDNVVLLGDRGIADVVWQVDGDPLNASAEMTAQFVRTADGWRWDGPAVNAWPPASETAFGVNLPVKSEIDGDLLAPELGRVAADTLAEIDTQLGTTTAPGTIWLYDGNAAMHAALDLAQPSIVSSLVRPGAVHITASDTITDSQRLTNALSQYVLAEAGIGADDASWLWNGLPKMLDPSAEAPIIEMVLASAENAQEPAPFVHDWMQMAYVWQALGPDGVGALISQASSEGVDAALQTALGLSAETLASEARTYWLTERIAPAVAATDALIAAREAALVSGDRDAFLATLDPNVVGLRALEEVAWEEAISAEVPTLSARVIDVATDGDGSVVVELTSTSGGSEQVSLARLTPAGDGLLWAGEPFHEQIGERVVVRIPLDASPDQRDAIDEVLTSAETLLADIDAWLGQNGDPLAVVVDPSAAAPDLVNGPVVVADTDAGTLAEALTRQRLLNVGVTDEWLLQATSAVLNPALSTAVENNLITVRTSPFKLTAFPTATGDAATKAPAQAADSGRYFVEAYGDNALRDLVRLNALGRDLDTAMQEAIGLSVAEFEAQWLAAMKTAHLDEEQVSLAEQVSAESLMANVDAISAPEFAGRQAGSDGAQAVAEWIAAEFEALGLEPIVVPDAVAIDEDEPNAEAEDDAETEVDEEGEGEADSNPDPIASPALSYFQPFEIDYSTLATTPAFHLLDEDGNSAETFAFMQDFIVMPDEALGSGSAEGELVWVSDGYDGMDFDGKIVLRIERQPLADEMADAIAHNAAGLIVVRDNGTNSDKVLTVKPAVPAEIDPDLPTIPVIAITQNGYLRLLEAIGQTQVSLGSAPPALPLGRDGVLQVDYTAPETRESVNVLGLLPGSDPALRDEIIVVGAHYDHVGDNPAIWVCDGVVVGISAEIDPSACEQPGLTYSGRNDNASGVAALLELASVWQDAGYRPSRSVLFAAFGAQEPGNIGSELFLNEETSPIDPDALASAMLLDGIGGGAGYYLEAQAERESDGMWVVGVEAAAELLGERIQAALPEGKSDDVGFRSAEIPTLLLTWSDASEVNWPDTIAEEVEEARLVTAVRAALLSLLSVAD